MPSWWVDFFNGDMPTIERVSALALEPVDGLFPAEEQINGYWAHVEGEIERQFQHEVKGG